MESRNNMTYIECILQVLKYAGYIAWFVISVALAGFGIGMLVEWENSWVSNASLIIGVISIICFIAFCIYKCQ